jgi:protein tyrosine/serine phosphatase
MLRERHLDWEGCFNVRDLGGLPLAGGGVTRWGAVVRADSLDDLTEAGWEALLAHGVRTVVDLRNPDERRYDSPPVPVVHVPLDAAEDREFWDVWENGPQFGTPLYYGPHLERHPERSAAAVAAIADAPPGGVAFHCGGGRDRAGQIAALVLSLVGVPVEAIVADYALSDERLTARYAARGEEEQGPLLAGYLAEQGTTAGAVLAGLLAEVDVEATLRAGGLTGAQVDALRARLAG